MKSVSNLSLEFLINQVKENKSNSVIICGFSGPQGSGKTYNCNLISKLLNKKGIKTIQFSMDDFYLTYEDQLKLQRENPNDWMLQGRGLPGTHDLKILFKVLKKIKEKDGIVSIPQYDKSKFNGKGDRIGFIEIDCSNLQVVIFEGWFNGYIYLPSDKMLLNKWQEINIRGNKYPNVKKEDLLRLNNNLKLYYNIWYLLFDCFICVKTNSIENVYKWRQQQEHDLIKKNGGIGMNDEQVKAFVDRYMPVYSLYFDRLELTVNMIKANIVIDIDLNRRVVS